MIYKYGLKMWFKSSLYQKPDFYPNMVFWDILKKCKFLESLECSGKYWTLTGRLL